MCRESWGLGPVPGHWRREQPLLLGEPLLKVPPWLSKSMFQKKEKRESFGPSSLTFPCQLSPTSLCHLCHGT